MSFNNHSEIRHFKVNECSVNVTKKEQDDIDECNGSIRITFRHSPVNSEINKNQSDEIVSPADIYNRFSNLCNKTPKSILKKSSKDYSHNKIEEDGFKNHITQVVSDTNPNIESLIQVSMI